MKNAANDVWVYIETDKEGNASKAGLELLAAGRELAEKKGAQVTAVIIGYKADASVKESAEFGADTIIIIDKPEYSIYTTDAYVYVMHKLVSKYGPDCVLIGATAQGRDMAPRLACRLKTGLTADCTGLDYDQASGCITWTRPAFGGNLMAEIQCPERRPQMGTVRPGVFDKVYRPGTSVEVIKEDISFDTSKSHIRILSVVKEITDEIDLSEAEIIVSGGRGVRGPDGFDVIRDAADVLGGMVGASRAAVDAGWIGRNHQVGQTGRTVSPKLYIACGISGAVQHIAGMSRSECIVAINSDPEAPIFRYAHYGIEGDLFSVLPAFTNEIKKRRQI